MDQTSQSDDETLLQFMQRFAQGRDPKNVVILVNSIDAALRAQKTQRDRIFRAAVRKNKAVHLNSGEVLSYFDCENVMVGLQLETGCSVRLCNSPELVADIIITYTKALADRPFKKEDSFSFHGDLGPGATRKALKEAGDKTGLIWQHQLLQYPGVSTPVASAIITKYPSPSHLLKAYGNCSSQKEAESLLEDIQVRRGAGVIASTRRVGASISKRIHFSMTCKQASELLSN
ncbi:PREDICTED: crossover junction endonuclease EME1-like [Amphimedon queenslandica]|uniref:Uncharacterized protein n=1 Tax=Amphimedon queenslandica TaxID=400682 RepID=A0A1X7SU82_AMPQE|nr:PREDICTED: crossover junction endonuclease EME1-like [Amphimedon queenslandica]|eukprot:XP_019862746.1 PREDICTED: crossover junction endonuclease EME1-like [Amphimedon queenslandica]